MSAWLHWLFKMHWSDLVCVMRGLDPGISSYHPQVNNINTYWHIHDIKIILLYYISLWRIIFIAVVMSEFLKLLTCLVLVYIEEGQLRKFYNALKQTIIKEPVDTLKVCVPSILYIIQNNLLYVSASNLDAATYQVKIYIFFFFTSFSYPFFR